MRVVKLSVLTGHVSEGGQKERCCAPLQPGVPSFRRKDGNFGFYAVLTGSDAGPYPEDSSHSRCSGAEHCRLKSGGGSTSSLHATLPGSIFREYN